MQPSSVPQETRHSLIERSQKRWPLPTLLRSHFHLPPWHSRAESRSNSHERIQRTSYMRTNGNRPRLTTPPQPSQCAGGQCTGGDYRGRHASWRLHGRHHDRGGEAPAPQRCCSADHADQNGRSAVAASGTVLCRDRDSGGCDGDTMSTQSHQYHRRRCCGICGHAARGIIECTGGAGTLPAGVGCYSESGITRRHTSSTEESSRTTL